MSVQRSLLFAGPLAALALWMALAVPSLDKSRLQEVDELTHARVAQGVALEGAWWPLKLDGRVFYEKPPLMLWLAGATAGISGRPYDSWPYRLWTCLGAGLALAALVLIGGELGRPWVGVWAALALALQGDFVYHARFFTFDTPFIGSYLWSLALSLRALRTQRARDWWWAGAALALAAAFKSWFILTLLPPYALAVQFHVPAAQRGGVRRALVLPAAVVMLLWILLYVDWNGWGFLAEEWSGNLVGRTLGKGFTLDPQGHAAYYLGWAALTSPACLPWALAAPPLLAAQVRDGAGAGGPKERARSFALTWTWVFCLAYVLGIACVKAETRNYALPLEACLCLAAGLILDADLGAGRSLLRTALLAASCLACLRLWDPFWSLGLGALLGFLWPALGSGGREARGTGRLNLALGLGMAALLGREAFGLMYRPLDPNAAIADLLLAHPAQCPGQTLWIIPGGIQAPNFYSSYGVRSWDALPARRPADACLVRTRAGWRFFPPAPPASGDRMRAGAGGTREP